MTYKQTIEFLFSSLPMYQRVGDAAYKKDLTNIKKLCSLLGDPHLSFRSIHVAGTNGKGSASHMLASIFQSAGKKVGLYTSPHYVDFRERIKLNGKIISESDVIMFVEKYRESWKDIEPSFFEITVAMAFVFFRNAGVDIAIIETGLGGRLDSTNIITPLLSVITNIGYDHMQMLGNTLPEIAGEKAGIIKEHIPVVIGEMHVETKDVFIQKAKETSSPIYFAEDEISIKEINSSFKENEYLLVSDKYEISETFVTDLTGPYQIKNIITVIASCMVWNKYYPDQLSPEVIKNGLRHVKNNTNMIGRWMIISDNPLVIADAAHNIDGMKSIIQELSAIPAGKKHFVLGFVNDKDIGKILSLFPSDAAYYWCMPDIPRGKNATETRAAGEKSGLSGKAHTSVKNAYLAALSSADADDMIFVGGSSYVVGDFLATLK